jgi:hypothetical protein
MTHPSAHNGIAADRAQSHVGGRAPPRWPSVTSPVAVGHRQGPDGVRQAAAHLFASPWAWEVVRSALQRAAARKVFRVTSRPGTSAHMK